MLPASVSSVEMAEYRNRLRRLSLKIFIKHGTFPTGLILVDVRCTDRTNFIRGGFANVYRGSYHGSQVALKTLRKQESGKGKETKAGALSMLLHIQMTHMSWSAGLLV